MFPIFVKEIVGAVVRWLLTLVFGSLIAKGIVSGEQVGELAIWIAGGALVLVWALWQKYRGEVLRRLALSLPAGTQETELQRAARLARGKNPPPPPGASGFVQGLAFVLVPALALGLSGCGKDDLAKGLRKAITSADFALKTAENAYQTGFLTYEQRRATFEVGRDLNATLTEANEVVATLPEEIITGKQPIAAADKAKLLAIFDEGVRRANRLVDNGNWIRDEKGREEYLKFARPVAAGLTGARRIAEALKVKPPPVPMPEPSPPFLDISRVFVA
jgi:hypothetical protein